MTDRLLLLNLYITQGLTLIIGLIWILFQKRNPFQLLIIPEKVHFVAWGLGLAAAMLIVDYLLTHIVPEESMDDGGINDLLFRNRPVWHIIVIAAIVSVCEELLFRGAIQYSIGPYWTSIVFALIHVRYLRHFVPKLGILKQLWSWIYLHSIGQPLGPYTMSLLHRPDLRSGDPL